MMKICNKTVMDTTDPRIKFDLEGNSDYYNHFKEVILPEWNFGKGKENELKRMAEEIKKRKKGEYDCIIGISGGLDSTYTTYVAKEIMGLNPLLLHVDAGWNTKEAVSNIEKIVDGLKLDLYTEVINWEEMKDLQLAFLKSGIPDQDLPQDAAFFSSLYKYAIKNNIRSILTGGNYSTECCREPEEWGGYPGIDKTLIMDIHNKFGKIKLSTLPLVDILVYKIFYRFFYNMKIYKPLNYIEYVKKDAEELLKSKFGFQEYQHKHHESRFTRFYEDFWMPLKFGYEKRKAHFSSLILTNQMTREDAIERLKNSEMTEEFMKIEMEYVADKLDIEVDELWEIFKQENKVATDYKNKLWFIKLGTKVLSLFGKEKRLFR